MPAAALQQLLVLKYISLMLLRQQRPLTGMQQVTGGLAEVPGAAAEQQAGAGGGLVLQQQLRKHHTSRTLLLTQQQLQLQACKWMTQ